MNRHFRPSHVSHLRTTVLALAAGIALGACANGTEHEPDAAEAPPTPSSIGVPVHVQEVIQTNLDVVVTAPGRTEALRQDRVRAPFPARLVSLPIIDGDRVDAGQIVAELVAKNSEAALRGARNMLSAARTAEDSADARLAITLARRNMVRQPLRAPTAGVALSHGAAPGDYVDEGEVLLTIAEQGAVYFVAQVSQSVLEEIEPGQRASIGMPAAGGTVTAVVHGILPVASSQNLCAPVRLDFKSPRPDLTVGLFGTARIVVDHHVNATVVPEAAVLRDDVSGVSRIAMARDGKAHWVIVKTGLRNDDRVEILSPALTIGMQVITEGQVGLPEAARLKVGP